MKISVLDPAIFRLFYVTAFTLMLVGFSILAIRKKLPMRSVLLILSTTTFFTVTGSRLFTIPLQDWPGIINIASIDEHSGRSALGGLLFGICGFILSVRFFRMERSVVPFYAWFAPAAFAVQKIGCFFNGCCYGSTTSLPWGVEYPVFTNAHYHQWAVGLIEDSATMSLGVHPVQLYESVLLLLVSVIVFRTRKLWKRQWSIMFFSLALLFSSKFISSLFRDLSSINFLDNDPRSMMVLRLLIFILITLSCTLLLVNERKLSLISPCRGVSKPSGVLFYSFFLAASVFILRNLFTSYELIAIAVKFIPAIILAGIYLFRNYHFTVQKIFAATSVAVPIILIIESFPQDTVKSLHPVKEFYSKNNRFHRVDIGTMGGSAESILAYNPHENECGGTSYTNENYKHTFLMQDLAYSYINRSDENSREMGFRVSLGSFKENNLTTNTEREFKIFSVDPYIKLDSKWIGVGFGMQIGNLRWIPISHLDDNSYYYGTKESPVLPSVSLRVGMSEYLDGRYNYGLQRVTNLPVQTHEFTLGSGFRNPELDLRAGVGFGYRTSFGIISAEGMLHPRFGINLKLNFGLDDQPALWGAFGVNYRFGFRE